MASQENALAPWLRPGLLALAALSIAGCSTQPSAPVQPAGEPSQARSAAGPSTAPLTTVATGQPYDFYLLNLSWSPEYCVTNPGAAECSQHLGFVVHGLWPQNNDGSYPKNCGSRPGPTSPSAWQGLFPTAALAQHEWVTHGVCTPYDADTYFGLIRKAGAEVQIPPTFTGPTQPASDTPADITAQFAKINTGIPPAGIALSCGNNALTAMEFCFDKNLAPIACQGVRTCRANSVKIPSIGGGSQ